MWTVDGKRPQSGVNAVTKQSKKRKRESDLHSPPPMPTEGETAVLDNDQELGTWSKVQIPSQLVDMDMADGDVISLEELEEYSIDEKGNIVPKENAKSPSDAHSTRNARSLNEASLTDIVSASEPEPSSHTTRNVPLPKPVSLPLWKKVPLELLNSLDELKYTRPTAIQEASIPIIRDGKDVVGIAETGSGKTLAYLIPILEHLLSKDTTAYPLALVLAPTRELALQIRDHVAAVSKYIFLRTAVIIGGLSAEKQRRQMRVKSGIWIATPGRLADLIAEDEQLTAQISGIHILVLDEVDRLLQPGHFDAMEFLLRHFRGEKDHSSRKVVSKSNTPGAVGRVLPQMLLFSATTDAMFSRKDLAKEKGSFSADSIRKLLGNRFNINRDFHVVDVRKGSQAARKLVQTKVECIAKEKDTYLAYILTRYPGRTLVFVNSIDGARRLSSILELLNFNVFTIHSELQQKQRLQRLERFEASKDAILLASDVAARGLDLPAVDHVIHFQVPRSLELYIHRSGRTARQHRDGISILFCCPEEMAAAAKLIAKLSENDGVIDFPIDLAVLRAVEKRVTLARTIDAATHQQQKRTFDKSWVKRMAEELEVEQSSDEDDVSGAATARNLKLAKVQAQKEQLKSLLKSPLRPKGLNAKYVSGALADIMMHAENHDAIRGIQQTKAIQDALNVRT